MSEKEVTYRNRQKISIANESLESGSVLSEYNISLKIMMEILLSQLISLLVKIE